MQCWYCRTLKMNVHPHKTINCRDPNNTHSRYYNQSSQVLHVRHVLPVLNVCNDQVIFTFCKKCNCVTSHKCQINNTFSLLICINH
jgi:hypothetical protein